VTSGTAVSPLADVVVADFTTRGPGPFTTMLLARLGARVIKFEPPGGEPSRALPPVFEAFNQGKESVVCDLRSAAGLALARSVADRADVVVTAWRPKQAAELGFDHGAIAARNPRAVSCAISGFGDAAQWSDRAGHELTYLAASGALAMIFGGDPRVPGMPIGDVLAGNQAALRICAALAGRSAQAPAPIDVSVAGVLAEAAGYGLFAEGTPLGADWDGPARGRFRSADGRTLILAILVEPHYWSRLCDALGLHDLAEASPGDLAAAGPEVRSRVAQRLAELDSTECESRLNAADVPWSWLLRPGDVDFSNGTIPVSSAAPELGAATSSVRAEFLGEG